MVRVFSVVRGRVPPALHLVLLARNEPPLPLVRWRARGDLHELQATDLRFSPQETDAFFQQMLPVALSEKTLAQLEERLEGWAAGLRLLALTMQGPLTARGVEHHVEVLGTMQGPIQPHHPIVDYFITEVLHLQPEPLQLFLLRTSVLSRLTGPLCDALMGRHDSAALLDAMEHAGLFLESLDDGGEWYRYHGIFAEAMRAVARQRLGDETLRALSLQASHWYEQHELPTEAVDAALYAGDMERATSLIERLVERGHFQFHELYTLRRWLEQMPAQVQPAHPGLCLAYAIALLFTQHPDPPTPALMARIDEVLDMADEGWQRAGDQARRGQVYAFRAMLAWREGRVEDAAREARQALAWLPEGEEGHPEAIGPGVRGLLEWRAINLTVMANAALNDGHVVEARRLFQEAQQRCLAAGNRPFVRIATLFLGITSAAMGELHQAEAYYQQVLPDAREQDDRDDIIFTLLSLIDLAYEWNDLDGAETMLAEVGRRDVSPDFPEIGEMAAFWQARLRHARGHTAPALQQIAGILARLHARATPRALQMLPAALVWQGRLHLAAGNLVAVQRSLDQLGGLGSVAPVQRMQGEELAARLLLVQGRADEALALLDRLLDTAQQQRLTRHVLEIQVLKALALAATRQAHEARQLLRLALAHAHTEGFMRIFLDEGEPMAALLRSLLPSLSEPALRSYARALLQSFKAAEPRPRAATSGSDGRPVEPLSAQEQRVLRLLAAGRSNAEIASELVVSVNTVKGHVKSLYRKLDVGNRLEASEAARRLDRV
jgi:LuxR family maltose regulon positive regulatory protein